MAVQRRAHLAPDRDDLVGVPVVLVDGRGEIVVDQDPAPVLLVQLAPPPRPGVGLWAFHLVPLERLRPELHAAVGRVGNELDLQHQAEIRELELALEEGVLLQSLLGLADDLAVPDRPHVLVAVPPGQVFAVEEVFRGLGRSRERHLAGAADVGDQVADVVFGERVEQPFRHHRELADAQRGDLRPRQRERLRVGRDRHRLLVLLLENADDGAAILGVQDPRLVVDGNDRVWVDDVFQDIVEVGAVGPGNVGPHLAAGAEEGVALGAGFGEQEPAAGGVRGRTLVRRDDGLEGGDALELFAGGGADDSPHLFDALVDFRVLEVAKLADDVGRNILRGDAAGAALHRRQQRLGELGPRAERRQGLLLLRRGEGVVVFEDRLRRIRVVVSG